MGWDFGSGFSGAGAFGVAGRCPGAFGRVGFFGVVMRDAGCTGGAAAAHQRERADVPRLGLPRAAALSSPLARAKSTRRASAAHARGTVFATWSEQERGLVMLYWAAVFFVIALVAAVLGFSGIAAGAAGIAKILFFVFLVLGALSLIFGRRVPA